MTRMSRRRKLLAGALTLAIAILVIRQVLQRDIVGEVAPISGTTATVVHGVHLIGNLGPSAAYAIETSAGLVLVDSGLEEDAAPLKRELEKLNLDWRTTRAIFLTHVHGDHTGGANHLREETGAKVYAGEADTPFIRAGTSRDSIFSTYRMPDHEPHPTNVDVALEGGEAFEFGDVRIKALATPGHTPGSTCYLLERGKLRVLFSGDVIMHLGPRPLGTYSTYLAPRFRGDAGSFLETLHRLRELPVPDLVLPGHPRDNARPENPRLTQGDWETLLDVGIRDMQNLVKRLETDGPEFLDGRPRELLTGLYYLGNLDRQAIYALSNDAGLFVFNAPGGGELAPFVKRRLQELQVKPREVTAILLTGASEEETSGLNSFVSQTSAQVVVSRTAIEAIRSVCPEGTKIIPAKELPEQGWFSVDSLHLTGHGTASVAYVLRMQAKTVVISGKIPVSQDADSQEQLFQELTEARAEPYRNSLRQLVRLRPDLWLPAVPVNDQNANLYDNSWQRLIERNRQTASGIRP